jgi:hypothetical protein
MNVPTLFVDAQTDCEGAQWTPVMAVAVKTVGKAS